jgi:cytosine/adenosine deaminase-related metal-dependent hydrolase
VFNGPGYLAAGGAFGIGSDSNVRIALGEELRTLEYSQRLAHRARNVLAAPGASVGASLYGAALAGGAQALGRDCGALRPGALADLVAIDRGHPTLAALTDDQVLDGWIFAADDRLVREVWSAGRHVVRDGRHLVREAVDAGYRRALAGILARI